MRMNRRMDSELIFLSASEFERIMNSLNKIQLRSYNVFRGRFGSNFLYLDRIVGYQQR